MNIEETYNYSNIINIIEKNIYAQLNIKQKIFINKFVEVPIFSEINYNLFSNYNINMKNILPLPLYTVNHPKTEEYSKSIGILHFHINNKKNLPKYINKNQSYIVLENSSKLYIKTSVKIPLFKLFIVTAIIRHFVCSNYLQDSDIYWDILTYNIYVNKHNIGTISNIYLFDDNINDNMNKYINLIVKKIIQSIKITFNYSKELFELYPSIIPIYGLSEILILNKHILNGNTCICLNELQIVRIDELVKQFIYYTDKLIEDGKYGNLYGDDNIKHILTQIKNINEKLLVEIWLNCFCINDEVTTYAETYFINSDLKYIDNFNHIFSCNLIYEKKLKFIPKQIYYIIKILSKTDKNITNIDFSQNNYCAFKYTCMTNNLFLAKWMYSLGNIDIHIDNDECFIISVKKGYLEFAQWLYSLGDIDIYSNSSEGFIFSCMTDDKQMYMWLWEISDNKQKFFLDWDSHWSDNILFFKNMYIYFNKLMNNVD